ncbi:protein kinase [candidate division NPL-UPA2 bacterium]|nr:protein kinase [candidate division NPL-UPA2 bacterium]
MQVKVFLHQLGLLTTRFKFKPHKYLVLLVVQDLIESKDCLENKFYFNDVFRARFTQYFNKYSCENDRNRPHTPFFHLKSSGFWHLKAKSGREGFLAKLPKIGSPGEIIENVDYAYLSEPVYELFTDRKSAAIIREQVESILKSQTNRKEQMVVQEEGKNYSTTGLNGSLFQHEKKAIEIISNGIKQLGRLTSNIFLYDSQSNNYYEYDIILVTQAGIYVVELKHWSGDIQIAPYNWVINKTHYRSDPHRNNILKCKILKGFYQHHFKTYPNLWVESVVVLTNTEAMVEGAASPGNAAKQDKHNLTFSSIEDFIMYLKRKSDIFKGKKSQYLLNEQQIDAIINYFNSLNKPKQGIKYNIPGYETVEYISQRPDSIELIARPVGIRARGLNRFRIFRIPQQITAEEKQRFVKKAYNTLNAISQIEDNPYIQKVWVMRNEDGDIIEGSEWSEAGTLHDLIRARNAIFSREEALAICRGIAFALEKVHQVDIIHRALKPRNVLIANNIPRLINFDLAYQIEENRLTVIADPTSIKDDGYVAPEILGGWDIDEGTDFFSLGVIVYELLAGCRAFSSVRRFIAEGGRLKKQDIQRLKEKEVPDGIIKAVTGMVLGDRKKRLKKARDIIVAFSKGINGQDEKTKVITLNPQLQPGSTYDVYEIIELLGAGRETQIYKAKTIRGKQVVLKLFNRDVLREKIFGEAEITSNVESIYVVGCDNKLGYWKNDRYFLVLDYIDGESMRNLIDKQERPDIDFFKTIALCLMEAVKAFHEYKEDGNAKPLVHSDIKPGNILITNKDKKVVLLDCGIAGEPRIDIFQGSIGYVPPDSIIGTDMQFSQQGDVFALGVTLWEWLFGEKPYDSPVVGDIPDVPTTFDSSAIPENIYTCLARAVATEASKRFASISEMQKAFNREVTAETETAAATPLGKTDAAETSSVQEVAAGINDTTTLIGQAQQKNPFVSYLNSLSNMSAGNENAMAESQVGNPFFDKIFVESQLTGHIYEKLVNERCNIILTGNAGDGKTTIAVKIYEKAGGEKRKLQPRENIADKNLVIIKDMSELTETGRIEVLTEAVRNTGQNYFIVSNTGTLLESFKKLRVDERRVSESELLKALEADAPQPVFEGRFVIINIGRIDSIKTACQVFKRMLEQQNWGICGECQYCNDCPLYTNVKLLQENLTVVYERIMLLYRRMYEYDIRLTMRQIIGHLAYAITAARDCTTVGKMSLISRQDCLQGSLFFNCFFGDNGTDLVPEAMQLLPVRQVRNTGFGILLDPVFERKIWITNKTMSLFKGEVRNIFQKLQTGSEQNNFTVRHQVRRLAYFFAKLDDEAGRHYLATFLRSPMLTQFLDFSGKARGLSSLRENKYRTRILQVLQGFFAGIRLPEKNWQDKELYITLNRRDLGFGTQLVLANFRLDDFVLVIKERYIIGDDSSKVLCLRLKQDGAEMELTLPFLDYVAQRHAGEVVEELSAYYANRLERFKVELLNLYNKKYGQNNKHELRLLRFAPDRRFEEIKVTISDKDLEVLW